MLVFGVVIPSKIWCMFFVFFVFPEDFCIYHPPPQKTDLNRKKKWASLEDPNYRYCWEWFSGSMFVRFARWFKCTNFTKHRMSQGQVGCKLIQIWNQKINIWQQLGKIWILLVERKPGKPLQPLHSCRTTFLLVGRLLSFWEGLVFGSGLCYVSFREGNKKCEKNRVEYVLPLRLMIVYRKHPKINQCQYIWHVLWKFERSSS